jgi:hypothetical protein
MMATPPSGNSMEGLVGALIGGARPGSPAMAIRPSADGRFSGAFRGDSNGWPMVCRLQKPY